MFGGGAKKEKKDDEEDRGDNSGSAKAQRDAAAAKKEGDDVSATWPRRKLCYSNNLRNMKLARLVIPREAVLTHIPP